MLRNKTMQHTAIIAVSVIVAAALLMLAHESGRQKERERTASPLIVGNVIDEAAKVRAAWSVSDAHAPPLEVVGLDTCASGMCVYVSQQGTTVIVIRKGYVHGNAGEPGVVKLGAGRGMEFNGFNFPDPDGELEVPR